MTTTKYASIITVIAAVLIGGCAIDDPNRRAKTGAAVGAVAGAVLGHQVHGDKGRYVGAAAGAAAGAALGGYMDKQQQEFEQTLATERQNNEIELQRMRDNTLKLNLNSEVSFDVNSDAITPAFRPSLDKLSSVIAKYDQTTVRIVGHTDSKGSDAHNQLLSERRAAAVKNYFVSQGVSSGRITTQGMGETSPRADNSTAAGRQLNRRVEIYLKAVDG